MIGSYWPSDNNCESKCQEHYKKGYEEGYKICFNKKISEVEK
jgi:hypothetical protein